ncbi:RagB/SusD family nutrient uptake outer membrane protein [Mariniflexile litorale]|uniref:RagB/SusD family nutrient uptake outer membrane protein n=1 Tax=Mariniflexile litorale TaxID=3045158 RepID=A0AAU7EAG4_9FLAO|nr:RagB/SusD family nutrient uptake outer membrane protein [Mariniflexile sp. KMM 9835]MDQ8210553.1 RagB/SusD family nutrient uptake outer membrane protein [Mariniflexile sp. KMM 9835]
MKNNIKLYSVFAIITSLVLGSCSTDFIEEKRDLSSVTNEVFEYEELSNQYVNQIYSLILPEHNKNMIMWSRAADDHDGPDMFGKATDEGFGEVDINKVYAAISFNEDHCLRSIGVKSTTSYSNSTWSRIRMMNTYFDQVDKFSGLTEKFKDQIKGQIYYWRAWQYFELVKLYGGIPLVLTAQDPVIIEGTDSGLQVPRSSTSASIDQIVADLDMAQTLLNQGRPYDAEGKDYGRITAAGAAALKGRVLLTWASPQFNRNDDQARWQRAYDACLDAKNICDAAGKGLHPNWRTMWFDGNDNVEAIIAYNFNTKQSGSVQKNNATERFSRPKDLGASGGNAPTKQIVDAFPMKDGTPYDTDGDLTDFYKDRDPRFYHSFAYNGSVWPYKENSSYTQWTYRWNSATAGTLNKSTENNPNASGIYLKKFTNPNTSELDGFRYVETSYLEFRYAEVLLNLAEAAIGINKLPEGKGYVRQIRQRAGIEAGTKDYGLSTVSSRDQHFAMCINERKVEFAYENKRFEDLRRWLLYDDTYGTVTRLGQEDINGSRRQGYYTVAVNANGTEYIGTADPFKETIVNNVVVPPGIMDRYAQPADYPSGVTTYEEYVDYLYDNHLKVIVRDDLEKDAAWEFSWYKEYYFFGIYENLYNDNAYLEQTQGWGGNFNPLN